MKNNFENNDQPIHLRHLSTSAGFMATTAIIILAMGTLAFSLTTMGAASSFADSVIKRELRIQARLNAASCLETLRLMAVKDYFMSGTIHIKDFGCTAIVTNDFNGHFVFEVLTILEGVTARDDSEIIL